MFSPVKAITVGVLVFTLGGAFLLTQPLDRQQANAPGAATDEVDPGPAAYTQGTMYEGADGGNEVETYDDDGNRLTLRGSVASGNLKLDDPRLSGAWRATLNIDEFAQPDMDDRVEVHWGEFTITNEDGSWSGPWKSTYAFPVPDEALDLVFYELTGAGAYEGLSALLAPTENGWDEMGRMPLAGAIFPGPLPPDSAYDE